ncbi:hypothetical protein QN277_029141 [Acacia crassicarpa]|uniref:Copia protein n=1 Tax=Acacia crassicarpa TaxID=499986 RepID=A0AAE1MJ60_9FABA|nr:hypothetical protein QN277_029141 [Acacia crassicarpa]
MSHILENQETDVVSLSSVESKHRVMADTLSELIWLRWMAKELGAEQSSATTLYCDNQAALHITKNPFFHEQMKHVGMDCYFVTEWVQSKEIEPTKIWTKEQLINVFTEVLGKAQFKYFISKLGIVNPPVPT